MIREVEPLLALSLMLVPVAFSLWARRQRVDADARRVAMIGSLVTTVLAVLSLGLVLFADRQHILLRPEADPIPFALDGENAVTVLLLSLVSLGGSICASHQHLRRVESAGLLATLGATLGLVTTTHIALFLVLWVASLVPMDTVLQTTGDPLERGRKVRAHRLLVLGSGGALAVGVGVYVMGGGGGAMALAEVLARGPSVRNQVVIFFSLALAATIRMGAFPLHGWGQVLLSHGAIGLVVAMGNVNAGMHLLTRIAMPMLPHACADAMPVLAALGLMGSLAGSVLSVVQIDLRRTVAMVMVSQTGLVLMGIASGNAQSIAGALFEVVAMGLGTTGLILLVGALESRTSTTEIVRLGGIGHSAPRMAGFFLAFSYASVGFPGTPTFIGEDLLLHGVIGHHPLVASVMLVATVLNGVSLFRTFGRVFLGPAQGRAAVPLVGVDLVRRERYAVATFFALCLVGGLIPGPVLGLRRSTVRALTPDEAPTHVGHHVAMTSEAARSAASSAPSM